MGKFTSISDHKTALTQILIPLNEKKRIHLVDVKARVHSDITLDTVIDSVSATLKEAPFDGPKGIWVVDLKAKKVAKIKLEAKYKDTVVASVNIEVFKKIPIVIPRPETEKGMLIRLLLAESVNPGAGTYDEATSRQAMQWMRLVIKNRLAHKDPGVMFNAKKAVGKHTFSIFDIVKAKGQFHGFEKYPNLDVDIKLNLNGFLVIANDYNHPLREKYAKFIENAISVASPEGLKGVKDPSVKGLYGWRTKGSSHPGGTFKVFQDLAGQTFYTLK